MIKIVQQWWWEVVAITCVWNRYWKDSFENIPLISCFIPPKFHMFYDKNTPEKNRWNNPRLPQASKIAEKPKNIWNDLIESIK